MRQLAALGLKPDDVLGPLPALSPLAAQAAHCWNFCGGWYPERWPVYAALHDAADWAALAELMQAIRDQQDKATA